MAVPPPPRRLRLQRAPGLPLKGASATSLRPPLPCSSEHKRSKPQHFFTYTTRGRDVRPYPVLFRLRCPLLTPHVAVRATPPPRATHASQPAWPPSHRWITYSPAFAVRIRSDAGRRMPWCVQRPRSLLGPLLGRPWHNSLPLPRASPAGRSEEVQKATWGRDEEMERRRHGR
ncbi:hypothetical protein L227DRAFT_286785 [Lentinus tigrinus ALCF2SS1-6]|uniref:Uncharacterized protein n=1 Tax=Lentinus tigrinus ALCF2SS1-6 TaxID=1328759 RepID=A0A5C2RYL2_9APHY|nr:hypothetical protein L227DRAFT_286785 [Lentinus tigrinus ALCF2SS1-6]